MLALRSSLACLAIVLALAFGLRSGAARADTAAWVQTQLDDQKSYFKAEGTLTTTDSDSTSGVFGPLVTVGGTYWSWYLCHQVTDWFIGNPPGGQPGAEAAILWIQGTHLDGPHDEDIDPNYLPSRQTNPVNIPFGKSKLVQIARRDPHPASDGMHHDVWGVGSRMTANPGAAPSVSGPVRIYAQHERSGGGASPWLNWITFGSSVTYSTVSFDASSGILVFAPGPIDILNRAGNALPGVDPVYSEDPLRQSMMWIAAIEYLGPAPEGGYRFGPGSLEVFDPDGAHGVVGSFSEYIVYPWERGLARSSVALLDDLGLFDADSPPDGPSLVLHDFADINLFGTGLPADEWLRSNGIAFAFEAVVDLAAITQGFTQPVFNLPVSLVVASSVDNALDSVPAGKPRSSASLVLGGLYPNPVREGMSFQFRLARTSRVRAEIFDCLGRLVDVPLRGVLEEGNHRCSWAPSAGRTTPSGMYYLRVATESAREVRSFTIVR